MVPSAEPPDKKASAKNARRYSPIIKHCSNALCLLYSLRAHSLVANFRRIKFHERVTTRLYLLKNI